MAKNIIPLAWLKDMIYKVYIISKDFITGLHTKIIQYVCCFTKKGLKNQNVDIVHQQESSSHRASFEEYSGLFGWNLSQTSYVINLRS